MDDKIRRAFDELIYLDKTFNQTRCFFEGLYLGDSVLERISKHDKDTRPLKDMVSEALKERVKIASISRSAYQPRVYYHLLLALKKMKHLPKVLILPLNMRIFSPQWDYHPEWQFKAEMKAIKTYMSQNIIPFLIINKNQSMFQKLRYEWQTVNNPVTRLSRVRDFQTIIKNKTTDPGKAHDRYQHIFIYHYLYPLTIKHRKLNDLCALKRLCDELSLPLFLYISPINYQSGLKFLGSFFDEHLRKNILFLQKTLGKPQNTPMVLHDYSNVLPSSCFFYEEDPTEHLNETGRARLTETLQASITDFYNAFTGVKF